MSNGLILWEGQSEIDGGSIVVIATGLRNGSTNAKTGSMIQTYILRSDIAPLDAVRSGDDVSICGTCPHRGDGTGKGRACYVNLGHGPRGVYAAYKRGSYPRMTNLHDLVEEFEGRVVRIGSYGDPASAPLGLWEAVVKRASGFTGYTHRWRECHEDFAALCMASVDSEDEMHEAHALGFRTFRVTTADDGPIQSIEINCPASEEAGKRANCIDCKLCSGASSASRKSIQIAAHGSGRKYVTAS